MKIEIKIILQMGLQFWSGLNSLSSRFLCLLGAGYLILFLTYNSRWELQLVGWYEKVMKISLVVF